MAEETVRILDPNLKYLWDMREIPKVHQDAMVEAGIRDTGEFGALAETRQEMRDLLRDDLGIDGATGLATKSLIGKFIEAWEFARRQSQVHQDHAAESKLSKIPVTLPKTEHSTTRRSYEKAWGILEKPFVIGHRFTEKRLDDISNGEFRADRLQEVTSQEEEELLVPGSRIEPGGAIKVILSKREVPLPTDSEGVRRRVKMIGISYGFGRIRCPNVGWLATQTPSIWEDHLTYVLGEDVLGFEIKNSYDEVVGRGTLSQTIVYEYNLRKKMNRLMEDEGIDIHKALVRARHDSELRAKYFTTPLSSTMWADSAGPTRPHAPAGPPPARADQGYGAWPGDSWGGESWGGGGWKGGGGGGKGGGRGRGGKGPYGKGGRGKKGGKGRGKGGMGFPPAGMTRKTRVPGTNEEICFAYNNAAEKCSGGCGRAHVCTWCLAGAPGHGTRHAGHCCPEVSRRKKPKSEPGVGSGVAAADALGVVAGADG